MNSQVRESDPTVRALLIDINGTIFDHGIAIEGAREAVNLLRDRGYALRFLTNTESKTVEATLESLSACGLEVDREELFTPVVAARTLLEGFPSACVLSLMSDELRQSLAAAQPEQESGPTHVVVGDCQDVLDYPLLNRAFRAVRAGAELIALQRGALYRTPQGEEFIDTGAIVAALEYGTGRTARLLGKPSSEYFGLAATSTGFAPGQTAVVGDDATTDSAGGNSIGATTIQVRTGKYAAQAAAGLAKGAAHTVDSIADVPGLLAGAA
ncbi:HAD-IIA family hydrolase [Streptomyces cinnamoneus]|uniref:HAD-IIA family hydrolase n=1 Tax=Streptomyces cinnamoneus TaxID=53446 RepID=UPI001E3518D1|nr:HAD-IIA family hydrolase [Streptomyces cinnamoneus]